MSVTGVVIRTNTAFSDTGLPKYKNDNILTDGSGSMMLVDVRTWAAGVPASGTPILNLAASKAAALGITGDTSMNFLKVGDIVGAGNGLIERTGKGGLHVIVRQSLNVPPSNGFCLNLPLNVMTYITSNPGHNYYWSMWNYLTRAALNTSPDGAKTLLNVEQNAANLAVRLSHTSDQIYPDSGHHTGVNVNPGANIVGQTYRSIGGPVMTNGSVNPASFLNPGIRWGTVAPQNNFNSGNFLSGLQSHIVYRFYLEDLTVSGRSWGTVDAIDKPMYDAAMGAGGRFNDDTFTNPSVLP